MKSAETKSPVRNRFNAALSVLAAFALAGCATAPPTQPSELVGFLADGKTTKAEVVTALGQPSGWFDAGRIFTYRLGHYYKSENYRVMPRQTTEYGWGTWDFTQFSLVLVFDDAGVLRKHSLVKVNK